MTKKGSWSGYRGDGKPVIPCVPESLIEKKAVKGKPSIKIPVDYRKPVKKSSTSRNLAKRMRAQLAYYTSYNNVLMDPHNLFRHYKKSGEVSYVNDAHKAGDLDLLRIYTKYADVFNMSNVKQTVMILRELGHDEVYGVIEAHHIDTYREVDALVQAYSVHSYFNTLNPWEAGLLIVEEIRKIAKIALSGEREKVAVIDVLKREITDHETVRAMVDEMLSNASSLSTGVL